MEWISVKDRLPEIGSSFLATDRKEMHTAHWCNDTEEWYSGGWESCNYCGGRSKVSLEKDRYSFIFTHWMPLPEPPKD